MSNSLPLRVYDGEKWVNIGVQSGQVLYQNEEPSSPQTGTIWIDSDDETAVLNDQDFLTINSASAIYAPSASPTFSGEVNLPATTNYDGSLLSDTLASKLDKSTGYALNQILNIVSSGTFVKADYPWLRAIKVTCVAAGGGGAGAGTTSAGQVSGGGGGGGGGAGVKFITDISSLSDSETLTVGAGGAGGTGNAGGSTGGSTTAFGVTALGGIGGQTGTSSVPSVAFGQGGPSQFASGADISFSGHAGTSFFAQATDRIYAGAGGGTIFQGTLHVQIFNDSGNGPTSFGAGRGGSSGRNTPNQATNRTGSDGVAGQIILELYS